ncbi:hypothetical protein MTO96_024142 [Rhipicephalus appendiculatus]
MRFHPADYAVFCILTGLSFAFGLYYSVRRTDRKRCASAHSAAQQEEVFLGGRSLPAWSLSVSLLASLATGIGVVSTAAHQYAYGLHFTWNIVTLSFTTPFIVYIFLPVLYQLKVTSVFQGGLRGVVWADCVQGIVLFAAPFVIIAKISYDSMYLDKPLRPLTYFDIKDRLLKVVWAGNTMVAFFLLTISLTSLALTYWYRDCDPMLTGAITRYDQVVPLYVAEKLAGVPCLRGLFLAGLVGASISTVSSVINSHAATFYVDVVSPHFELGPRQAMWVTHFLELGSGTLMTAFAVLVPYMGTATRISMGLYSGASGPFAGMVIVAICLPWTNTKGTAIATSAAFAFELWQTVGRTLSGLEPPRMNTTLLHCAYNVTARCTNEDLADASQPVTGTANLTCGRTGTPEVRAEDVFFLYRISPYWSSFMAMLATVALSLVLSLFLGNKEEFSKSVPLSSPTFLRLWARLRLLPDEMKQPGGEVIVKSDDNCSQEELATMVPVTKLPDGHHLHEDGIDPLS